MEHTYVIVILAMGALFFLTVICALHWSAKKGQWNDLNNTARSIFSEDEPEGVQTDFFPGKAPISYQKSASQLQGQYQQRF